MDPQSLKCPRCTQATLVATDRNEIEIDVCPSCRGVWLDRGELDKIIERSLSLRGPAQAERGWGGGDDDDHGRREPDERDRDGRPRRRESWLSNLFD